MARFYMAPSFCCPNCHYVLEVNTGNFTMRHPDQSLYVSPEKRCPNVGKVYRLPTIEVMEVPPPASDVGHD